MPFPTVAAPLLVGLTLHFGGGVLSLPGYSATFNAQPEPAVATTACRDPVDEVYAGLRNRGVCLLEPRDEERLTFAGFRRLQTSQMGASHTSKSMPTPVPLVGFRRPGHGNAQAFGAYGVASQDILTPFAKPPRQWLSLQEK